MSDFRIIFYIAVYGNIFLYIFTSRRLIKPNPELERYRAEINMLSKGDLGKLNTLIEFKELENDILGMCNGITRTININSKYWDYLDQRERFILIAHEFFHCDCPKYEHNDKLTKYDICPESYMSSKAGTKSCTFFYFQQYLNQIAQGCKYKY